MDTLEAVVTAEGEKRYIRIGAVDEGIRIPLSEEDSGSVKQAFNRLIQKLRGGVFEIALEEAGDDLVSQVAKEYLRQLNSELKEVYREMERVGLVEE